MKSIEELLAQGAELASQLRALRETSGMSGKDLAAALGWYPSKVSRLETGTTRPSESDVDQWVRACGATPEQKQPLLDLLAELELQAAAHRDWRKRARAVHTAIQDDYNERMAAASRMASFETAFIPGMLQTPAYASCVFEEMQRLHQIASDRVETVVAARLRRQQHLYDHTKQFAFLIAEPALLWGTRPPDVMRPQLDRLLTASTLPNVRLGILPLRRPLSITPQNSFALFDDVAILETFTAETICGEEESLRYARVLELLWESALEDEDARQLITQTMQCL